MQLSASASPVGPAAVEFFCGFSSMFPSVGFPLPAGKGQARQDGGLRAWARPRPLNHPFRDDPSLDISSGNRSDRSPGSCRGSRSDRSFASSPGSRAGDHVRGVCATG
jgi:hypothetical protein